MFNIIRSDWDYMGNTRIGVNIEKKLFWTVRISLGGRGVEYQKVDTETRIKHEIKRKKYKELLKKYKEVKKLAKVGS